MNTPKNEDWVLASEMSWYSKGTHLFDAYQSLTSRINEQPFTRLNIVVGRQYAQNLQRDEDYRESLQAGRAMLAGMMLEAWMKGILVMQLTNQERTEISRIISSDLSQTFLADFQQGTVSAQDQRVLDVLERKRTDMTQQAVSKLKQYMDHNLVRLAGTIGLSLADPQDLSDILTTLSRAILLGRYPAEFQFPGQLPMEFSGALEHPGFEAILDRIFELADADDARHPGSPRPRN